MTDTSLMYKRLTRHLDKTRIPLWQACKDLGIPYDTLDFDQFEQEITQCTHCDIWTTQPVKDLDENPICKVCLGISGL